MRRMCLGDVLTLNKRGGSMRRMCLGGVLTRVNGWRGEGEGERQLQLSLSLCIWIYVYKNIFLSHTFPPLSLCLPLYLFLSLTNKV